MNLSDTVCLPAFCLYRIHIFLENVKLEGGGDNQEGTAMIQIDGLWGSVCDVKLDLTSWPRLFCRSLGFDDVLVNKVSFLLTTTKVQGTDTTVYKPHPLIDCACA